MATTNNDETTDQRIVEAVGAVLPVSVEVLSSDAANSGADVVIGGYAFELKWLGEGTLGRVRNMLQSHDDHRLMIVGARRMSPGARAALSEAGISWVDESGAAEIAVGSLIVSRSGTPDAKPEPSKRWTPSALAVAESILSGSDATVSAAEASTGLSTGACVNALRTLADLGLLEAEASRGRNSARRVTDPELFLGEYSEQARRLAPSTSMTFGVTWNDAIEGVFKIGDRWASGSREWVSTGLVAAAVMAPLVTSVRAATLFVDAETRPSLEAAGREAGLKPVEGGRLTLRPFPTLTTKTLSTVVDGLRVAPWPRVYVDLLDAGVRGEEAAEHLREVVGG